MYIKSLSCGQNNATTILSLASTIAVTLQNRQLLLSFHPGVCFPHPAAGVVWGYHFIKVRQPKARICIGRRKDNWWYVHTKKYCPSKNKKLIQVIACINLKCNMLSEESLTQDDILNDSIYIKFWKRQH